MRSSRTVFVALLLMLPSVALGQFEEVIHANQVGLVETTNGTVHHLHPQTAPPTRARAGESLATGDALRTLEWSRATVRFRDKSDINMRDMTRLVIDELPGKANIPLVILQSGSIQVRH